MVKNFMCLSIAFLNSRVFSLNQNKLLLCCLVVLFLNGCGDSKVPNPSTEPTTASVNAPSKTANSVGLGKEITEEVESIDRIGLLARRLDESKSSEGWINLFDGNTLFGWRTDGKANFRVEDGVIVADEGEMSLLCSNMNWGQYELIVEYRAEEETNSGVFLSSSLIPGDVSSACYEINIAPPSHPYPTGSLVERQKANAAIDGDSKGWHVMRVQHDRNTLKVEVDGVEVCDYQDSNPPSRGRIGLQHNKGRVEFRKVMLRPIGLASLLDRDLAQWKQYPEMDASFTTNEAGELHVQGGSGQMETIEQYGDFLLLAQYKLPTPEMNSGIFFRCIPGDKMMGYECQVSNFGTETNSLLPEDCGTGGIFRRQDARLIAGETNQWATVVLQVEGPSMSAWVNGIQVSDWTDTREVNENPRRGLRLEAGTIMIQGHDPKTNALFKQFNIRSLP